METFETVPMLLVERAALATAAKKVGLSIPAYLLACGLADAKKGAGRVLTSEQAAAHQGMIAAYFTALGYTPDALQMGRIGKAASALAKQGRDPHDLGAVYAWIRGRDSRYRDGAHLPLEIIAEQWPAYLARQARIVAEQPAQTPLRVSVPVVADQSAALFGDVSDDIEF
ncbi:MAG: hypothetical protein WCG26_00970 [Chloroflexales bacterium]